jgi:OOP family OmpA-OmpF porin
MNMTLPELDMKGALRGFGFSSKVTRDKTMLFYGPTSYTTAGFQEGLDKVVTYGGTTPMTASISAATLDFGEVPDQVAVIVISDGKSTDKSPIEAAQNLKGAMGDRVCIYTIQVGDDASGKATLEGVTQAGECGFYTNADDIMSTDGIADFVEKVFLIEKPDECIDADEDGVCDDVDRCLGTPKGARVDADGCCILADVLFDFDRSVVRPEAFPLLDEVALIIVNNPGLRVILEGHTDSIGSEAYNMGLSKRRAEAVKDYLVNKGVSSDQMATVGYGESKPVATNQTKEGRQLNRRTEITPEK